MVALNQAQQYAQAAQWSETISVLQAAIDQCQQYVASEQSTAQSTSSQTLTQQKPEQQNAEAGQTAAILHQAKGDLFANQGDIAAAIASYQKALALAPEADEIKTSLGKTHLAEAALMHRSGNITAATKSYLQALTQSPQLFSAYSRLRYNLLRYDIPRGDPLLKDVVEVCEASLAKHPNIKPAQITLGYALTKLDRLPEAIDCYHSITPSPEANSAEGSPNNRQRRSPDFIIVGAEKSGTTSLHQYFEVAPSSDCTD